MALRTQSSRLERWSEPNSFLVRIYSSEDITDSQTTTASYLNCLSRSSEELGLVKKKDSLKDT